MNLVVVSNRVSRGKPNEPMTGGLAAALLPIVEKSGAIWVGSSGTGPRREPEGTFCRNRSTGYRCAGDARSAGRALRRLLRRLCEFRIVAGAAFARRSDPRHAGGLSQLSRSERLHGARAVAIPKNRFRVLDSGLPFPRARRRTARSRRHRADRLLPAYAVAVAFGDIRRAASSRADRGDAGL